MGDIANLDAAGLLTRASADVQPADLVAILTRGAYLASLMPGGNPALALALYMLADMPAEIAALWSDRLEALASQLHPHTDGPTIARAAARAVAQFADDAIAWRMGTPPPCCGGEGCSACDE